jgi:D-glycero-D-manno-heptose 1,7-bisphosphate phosphatase
MHRAVFLDRDGTLIVEKHYLKDPAEVELLPGVGEALRVLQDHGFLLVVVTNQSGVGRGLFTVEQMKAVNQRMEDCLAGSGVRIAATYFAPEAPDQPSRGRKPSPQFLFDARAEFGIDLARSYMVGDKMIDLECGWNAGVAASILVRTGYGAEVEKTMPDRVSRAVIVDDLGAAQRWIVGNGAG